MNNKISDPKYLIGDMVLVERTRGNRTNSCMMRIVGAYYNHNVGEIGWIYTGGPRERGSYSLHITEEEIIKKLK